MASKIVLISNDSDFFEYIRNKLELRKSDELFTYRFAEIPEIVQHLSTSVLIVNSENCQQETLELLGILKGAPIIVTAYNEDDVFKKKCYRSGTLDFMPLLTPDTEFRARILPALSVAGILEKNLQYRNILVNNDILSENNEVFINYEKLLENQLSLILNKKTKAVFAAISPSEKTKLKISPNIIETIILNNIRKNDILMNYAPNKYFLILFNTDLEASKKLWEKISDQMPYKIYAGLSTITNQTKQKLINEALNKLHEAINYDKTVVGVKQEILNPLNNIQTDINPYSNFKMFRQEFKRKIEQIITPVFYQVQQKYRNKLLNTTLEQHSSEGYGSFVIKNKHSSATFKITSPGFSKINIDITLHKNTDCSDSKRITLEPEELESGLLQDLLEQFITEYTKENSQNA